MKRSGKSPAAKPTVSRVRKLPRIPSRRRDAHKGSFGRVLVVGGSRGMLGAPALSANAALRSGAGLVTVACPASVQPIVASLCPCATSIPLPENVAGQIDPAPSLAVFREQGLLSDAGRPSVVAAGPGLARGDHAFDQAWLELLAAFGDANVPVVLDADGLRAMHKSGAWNGPGWDGTRHVRTVITPHPGEMAYLHGVRTTDVQSRREAFAAQTATMLSGSDPADDDRAVVVLKGAGTVVSDGRRLYANPSGNPGMATGGSGDVLTGVISALIGQGLSTFDAAVLGVYDHGLAGDLAAKKLGQPSHIAADLVDFLPAAFEQHRRR